MSVQYHIFDNCLFKLGSAISALFYIWCGMLFKKYIVTDNKNNTLQYAVLSIVGIAFVLSTTIYLGDSINMAGNYFTQKPLLATIASIVGCITLYYVSQYTKKSKYLSRTLIFLGINSMFILGTHQSIRYALRLCFSHFGFSCFQTVLPIFILIPLISYPLILFVNKYIPIFVGSKKKT